MGTLTGGEGREAYAKNPVILLPLGSHEDQGPHAPMGDYLLAEKMAELIALRATAAGTPTFVAPVLPFGGADWFGPMIGGIAIHQSTLVSVLTDMLDSLHRNGLTRVVVINGHGGNVGPVTEVARDAWQERKQLVPSLYLWRIAYALLPKLIGAEKAKAVSGHGADPLTSLGLHLFPELLRTDLIPEGQKLKRDSVLDLPYTGLGAASFEGAEIGLPMEYDDTYHQGVAGGDPKLCSAETGKVLSEALADIASRFVVHFAGKVPA
ncbi:creatininase family protein [Muricoccus radiodurans]|uniref:creatininase family protein n=1 Tax=Muricoccus radiodurans TaxID=2231721 RepID=UPI003CFA7595